MAEEWGTVLKTKRKVPDDVAYAGYRAHDFIPVWGERGENMLKFELESTAALPFEQNYYLKPKNGNNGASVICWFVQREKLDILQKKGMPDYLELDEEKILLLK